MKPLKPRGQRVDEHPMDEEMSEYGCDVECIQGILESWVSEAIDLGDYARCRAICDVYWDLWFAENEERKAA